MDHTIMGLDAVCEITGNCSRVASDCLSALALQSRLTKKHSNAKQSEIERAAKLVTHGRFFNKNESMRIVQETVEHGERRAVGSNRAKKQFLETVKGGKDDDFLKDVWAKLDYDTNPRRFKGKCGQVLGSQKYIDHIEQHVFGHDMSNYYSSAFGKSIYKDFLLGKLENIAEIIRRDLKNGEINNDYLTDESVARIKEVIAELERCGVKYSGSKERIDRLAWFVGGDPQQIRELQKMLNELGIEGEHGRLKVDGVYGRETHASWVRFLKRMENGAVPSLVWIDPLQTDSTGLKADIKITKRGERFSQINAEGVGKPVFRADVHSYNGIDRYFHVNTDALPKANPRQIKLAKRYDHFEISEDAYNVLINFDNIAKPVRIAGKVLLVAGVVLDTLELGLAVTADLKDADKKLGRTTATAIASIGGRWVGGLAGAKIGATIGAAAGTALLPIPGVGTAVGAVAGGVFLGIVGTIGGNAFATWIVDVSCLED